MDPAGRRRIGETALEVTSLGMGGAAIGNLYAPVAEETALDAVASALEAELGFFDTAPLYGFGLSEARLGRVLRERARPSYVLSTKVGRLLEERPSGASEDPAFVDALPFEARYDYSYDGVMRSFEESLSRLGTGRIDMLLLHDIGLLTHGESAHAALFETAMAGGFRALEELRRTGAVAAVGLGVNESAVCFEALQRVALDCILLAGRYTLLEQGALELLRLCEERGVSVVVGGPYNSGLLATEAGSGSTYDYRPAPGAVVERARRIGAVCARHRVPLQAAALQFPLRHRAVASVIPGARSRTELEQNADFVRHPIPDALWSELCANGLLDPGAPTAEFA